MESQNSGFLIEWKVGYKVWNKRGARGELSGPVSTTGLSDGRIVMADYGNHRIQMFAWIDMMSSQLPIENRTFEKLANGAKELKLKFSLFNL